MRMQVKSAGVADVVEVYGDTAVPWLAGTLGFRETLLFADPAGGQLISQTGWRDPAARAASPSVAEMIRSEVLADDGCQIRAAKDYRLSVRLGTETGPGLVVKPRIPVCHGPDVRAGEEHSPAAKLGGS